MSNDLTLFRDKNVAIPAHITRGIEALTKSLMG